MRGTHKLACEQVFVAAQLDLFCLKPYREVLWPTTAAAAAAPRELCSVGMIFCLLSDPSSKQLRQLQLARRMDLWESYHTLFVASPPSLQWQFVPTEVSLSDREQWSYSHHCLLLIIFTRVSSPPINMCVAALDEGADEEAELLNPKEFTFTTHSLLCLISSLDHIRNSLHAFDKPWISILVMSFVKKVNNLIPKISFKSLNHEDL